MANKPTDVFRFIDMHSGDCALCWEWKRTAGGGRDNRPYFHLEGRKVLAYRVVYELFHGAIPPNTVLRHTCDNQRCCNPHHLVPGTQQENMNDMKQRQRHGLTHHVVKAIRRLIEEGRTHASIAALYGVSRETVTAIANERIYKDVTE